MKVCLVSALISLSAIAISSSIASTTTTALPNIILLYADDLGYGDVGCYGSQRIKTPNIDSLAAGGLRFTDGHSAAASCTPSRYAMLTGQYAWRKKGTGILPGDASLIIPPGSQTMPSMLKAAGYRTGAVGKWHLGLGDGKIDWNSEIEPGPLEIGFDECYIMPATGDRVPCVFLGNRKVVGLDPKDPIEVSYKAKVGNEPTGKDNPELLTMKPNKGHDQTIINGISRIGYMSGGKAARWKDEELQDVLLGRALSYIEKNKDKRFFLYYAFHEPHVPRVPHPRFAGKTGMGPRGDVIAQMDWSVGEVLAKLDRLKIAGNTMIIFSSDNGPVLNDSYDDDAVKLLGDHKPAGPYRGTKYTIFEGGTRVPLIIRWPDRIKPGVSDALVSQVDFVASFAKLVGGMCDRATATDSADILNAFLGESESGRESLVEQAAGQALRKGSWKFIPAGQGLQLYDLDADPGETANIADANPGRVAEMRDELQRIRKMGPQVQP